MEKGVICQEKNRLLPIEIKHTLLNWGLMDYRKKSAFFQNHAGQKVDLKSGSGGQFLKHYIFQETV
jgi:hypothetical protein